MRSAPRSSLYFRNSPNSGAFVWATEFQEFNPYSSNCEEPISPPQHRADQPSRADNVLWRVQNLHSIWAPAELRSLRAVGPRNLPAIGRSLANLEKLHGVRL